MTSTAGLSDEEHELLHETRLRGLVVEPAQAAADRLCEAGLARRKGSGLVLTGDGRAMHAAWARLADGSEAHGATERVYVQFLPLNVELLRVSTDWQVRPGNVPNDHSDQVYDWKVLDRLVEVDERAGPLVRRLGTAVTRFGGYRPRLREALHRVRDGEHDWFASPRCDSYHTVWMQLHEDLLLALGRERASEPDPA